ncbi:hypothetical protein FIBSPDRAFT_1051455 [Athelia psychrophila]|uniref:Uncharacterized protein n=1 Tax=Athelia psychrophila TaxID=1759441 RepID=A0A165Z515_9AGAM|nr:hypothetical protein FIBSPDRAFT_1051455 [Fibularhizoctonia sp. CBS 109695]
MSQNYDGTRCDINPISDSDKTELRKALMPATLHLSAPRNITIRPQVAESISLIAKLDFPERWLDLSDVMLLLEIYDEFSARNSRPRSRTHEEFWGLEQGWFVQVLNWNMGVLGGRRGKRKRG